MKGSRNTKVTKAINIGENEKYDNSIQTLSKNSIAKFAKKLGKLFQSEEFENMNVDTFINNISQIVKFFKKRNVGILKKDEAYISEDNIIDLINRYPRLLQQNPLKTLEEKMKIFQELDLMSDKELNILFKSSKGFLFSIGNEKLYKTLTFLNELQVLPKDEKPKNSALYILQDLGEANLKISTEKTFQRLLHIVTVAKTTIIPKKEFDFCFKRNDLEYEKRYGKSKQELDENYILPRTKDKIEYRNKVKEIVQRQSKINEVQKVS